MKTTPHPDALGRDPPAAQVPPYSQLAAAYDRLVGNALSPIVRQSFERALGDFGVTFRSAADIGCGTGAFLAYLLRYQVPLWGVDISPAMLRIAARRLPSSRVRLLRQDIRRLALPRPVELHRVQRRHPELFADASGIDPNARTLQRQSNVRGSSGGGPADRHTGPGSESPHHGGPRPGSGWLVACPNGPQAPAHPCGHPSRTPRSGRLALGPGDAHPALALHRRPACGATGCRAWALRALASRRRKRSRRGLDQVSGAQNRLGPRSQGHRNLARARAAAGTVAQKPRKLTGGSIDLPTSRLAPWRLKSQTGGQAPDRAHLSRAVQSSAL